jgi:hypothetical protein
LTLKSQKEREIQMNIAFSFQKIRRYLLPKIGKIDLFSEENQFNYAYPIDKSTGEDLSGLGGDRPTAQLRKSTIGARDEPPGRRHRWEGRRCIKRQCGTPAGLDQKWMSRSVQQAAQTGCRRLPAGRLADCRTMEQEMELSIPWSSATAQ